MPSLYPEGLSKPSNAKVHKTLTLEDVQKNQKMIRNRLGLALWRTLRLFKIQHMSGRSGIYLITH
jgi:hypothetical protein